MGIIGLEGKSLVVALGLVIASRGTSEEFANGVLNFICWPMMFLSEVWFSIEGAPDWLQTSAKIFPLTHLLVAARKVMNEGAGLVAVMPELAVLCAMTVGFLLVGAAPNAIAYGSGQFTTAEFFKAGIPASILLLVVLSVFVWIIWPAMGMPVLLN